MHIYTEIQKNPLLHLCITEPLRLGHAEIIAESDRGILAYDGPARLHLLAADDADTARALLSRVKNPYFILCCNAEFEPLLKRFRFSNSMVCRQFAYLDDRMPESDARLIIAPPDDAAFEVILSAYRMSTPEELTRQRNAGEIFFARTLQGQDVGFVGLHPEGCFGMLQVFPDQRSHGYGASLERHIIRFCMERGCIPYCQVKLDNPVSLQLQAKLGLHATAESLYMAWQDA